MISPNELRLGNIFWESYGGENVVTAINCNSKGEWKNSVLARNFRGTVSGLFECEYIHPIIVTTDILKKCGAEKFPSGKDSYILHGILLSFADCRQVYTHNGKELKHLHTLQNYIFALTEQELTINL